MNAIEGRVLLRKGKCTFEQLHDHRPHVLFAHRSTLNDFNSFWAARMVDTSKAYRKSRIAGQTWRAALTRWTDWAYSSGQS